MAGIDSTTSSTHQVSFTQPHVCFSKDKRSKYICPGTLNFQDLSPLSVSDNRAPAVLSAATTAPKTQREREGEREVELIPSPTHTLHPHPSGLDPVKTVL